MSCQRIDRGEAVSVIVVDVERLQVPRRHDMLRTSADRKMADHPERPWIDDIDGAALAVGDVDPLEGAVGGRTEIPWRVRRIDVRPRTRRTRFDGLVASGRYVGGSRPWDQLAQRPDRPRRLPPSDQQDSAAQPHRREVGTRRSKPPRGL